MGANGGPKAMAPLSNSQMSSSGSFAPKRVARVAAEWWLLAQAASNHLAPATLVDGCGWW